MTDITTILFVRHAQPDEAVRDDRTRPLTELGMEDSLQIAKALRDIPIDRFYSSPYRRSKDTISDCARKRHMEIHTDERFRERGQGIGSSAVLQRRWDDFSFCEEYGESLGSVQSRNMEALKEILQKHQNETIVIGTHGTALSTILHYYDSGFGCEGFIRIYNSLPYIIQLDFEGETLIGKKELFKNARGYQIL